MSISVKLVTSRITDTFFSLHPEQRSYQDPRLKRRNAAARSAAGGETSSIGAAAVSAFASATGSAAGGASGEVVRPDLT